MSCTKPDIDKVSTNIDFNKDYSFSEFKKILDEYNEQRGFPKIDD